MNEIATTIIESTQALEAINRSEIDMQISTAKQYPRDVAVALRNIEALATMDEETAAGCFYHLERKNGSTGEKSSIDGLSVRMAEIIATQWGNLRAQARIIANDGKFITAQGVCHDLETNVAFSVEVKRRITTSKGYTMSDDMQVVTGNAACSIAFRNAVLKVVPKAVTASIVKNVQQKAINSINSNLENRRAGMLNWFTSHNVAKGALLEWLGVAKEEDIQGEHIAKALGLVEAINEGTTTIDETFKKPAEQKELAQKATQKAQEAKAKAQAAVNAQQK